mmetsp:Transcript_19864/g.37111  ORF Transcript_19864/g.37111 Transcript_19864/m.37111 type:complete len:180 (+) Transcript_19864:161-700(+)
MAFSSVNAFFFFGLLACMATVASANCADYVTCESCLTGSCAYAGGNCIDSCDQIFDNSCVDSRIAKAFGYTSAGACAAVDSGDADTVVCNSKKGCESCVATRLLSDREFFCQWYVDTNSCESGCLSTGQCGADACAVPFVQGTGDNTTDDTGDEGDSAAAFTSYSVFSLGIIAVAAALF